MSNPLSSAASRPLSPPPSAGAFKPHPPPYVECLHWSPRRFAAGDAPRTRADIVFTQSVLKRMREHATAFPEQSAFGLLLGRVFRDPAGHRPWVRVEEAVRTAQPMPEDSAARVLASALEEAASRALPGRMIVGWYRSHRTTGLFLSEEEARLHEARFPEPWQCAVVLLGTERQPTGGVFQTIEGDGLIRGLYTPFYELIDPSSELGGRQCRTFAGWGNYQSSGPAVLAGRGGVSAALPPPSPADTGHRENASSDPEPGGPERQDAGRSTARDDEAVRGGEPLRRDQRVRHEAAPPADEPLRRREPPQSHDPPRREETGPGSDREPVDPEEAWERKQIQRSLTAVGRTLGPASLGELGSQAPPPMPEPAGESGERSDEEPTSDTRGGRRTPTLPWTPAFSADAPPATERLPAGEPVAPDASFPTRGEDSATPPEPVAPPASGEPAAPQPPRPTAPDAPASERSGTGGTTPTPSAWEPPGPHPAGQRDRVASSLVGRARRRARVPARRAAAAAIGLLVLTGGAWGAVRLVGGGEDARSGGSPALAEGGELAGSEEAPSAAAISLRPGDLLGPRDRPDPERGPTGTIPDETGDPAGDARAEEDAPPLAESPEPAAEEPGGPSEGRGTAPPTVDDPAVAAYESALVIFRKEAVRYGEVRRAYDDGLEGCNVLNLAYRGVQESFARLEGRFEDARPRFDGPAPRPYRSAEREMAVVDRHYELTPCPPPVGG